MRFDTVLSIKRCTVSPDNCDQSDKYHPEYPTSLQNSSWLLELRLVSMNHKHSMKCLFKKRLKKKVILICYIINRMRKCPHNQEQFQSSKPFHTLAHNFSWMRSIISLQIKAFWQRHQSRTFSFKIKASKRILASPLKYFNQGLTQKVQKQYDLQQSPGPPVVLPHWGGTGRSLHMCSCSEASQPCAPSVLGATSSHR